MTNNNGQMHFDTGITSSTNANFAFGVTTRTPTQLLALAIQYLVLTDSYAADDVNMHINNKVFGGGSITSNNSIVHTVTLPTGFNITGGLSVFASIVGMDVSSQSTISPMELHCTPTTSNTTIIFTITANQATPTTFTSIVLQYIVFNTNYYNRANFAAFSNGQVSGSATATGNRRL